MANWFPYVPPKTRAHENRCPLRATRLFFGDRQRAEFFLLAKPPAATRASARAGAGSAACAGHAERSRHRLRPARGSFRAFRRSRGRASRSVRPASTPAFPSAPPASVNFLHRIAIPRVGGSSVSRGIRRNEARDERELTSEAASRVPVVSDRVSRVAPAPRRPNAPPASSACAFAERLRGDIEAPRRGRRDSRAPKWPADRRR